jgi:hypothetical protein
MAKDKTPELTDEELQDRLRLLREVACCPEAATADEVRGQRCART